METTTDKLHLVRPSSPFMAVQINIDVPGKEDYREVMEQALVDFVEQNPNKPITIYTHVSFGVLLVGAARSKPLTEALLAALRDYMRDGVLLAYMQVTDEVFTEFHIEKGIVWRKDDALYWSDMSTTANQATGKNSAENADDWDDDEDYEGEGESAEATDAADTTVPSPAPSFSVDERMTVGELQEWIEDCFGLPQGSVRLFGPKKALRSDAKVSTLHRYWEE